MEPLKLEVPGPWGQGSVDGGRHCKWQCTGACEWPAHSVLYRPPLSEVRVRWLVPGLSSLSTETRGPTADLKELGWDWRGTNTYVHPFKPQVLLQATHGSINCFLTPGLQ